LVAFATASAAASNTASAEWTYLLVMLCVLWPIKDADGRLVVAEIGGQIGEAVTEDVGRDVGWQITQLGDPQPLLPLAYHLSAGPAGEHRIAGPRLGLDTMAALISREQSYQQLISSGD
jgi:hypothetical protein